MQIDGIEILIEGSSQAHAPTIVMLHGWPDTHHLWDAQVAVLSTQYRCVRFTLPGFDKDRPPRVYSIDELCAFFEKVVRAVSPAQPVILLLHDWGCLFGYEFYMRQSALVKAIVGVDIGDAGSAQYLNSLSGKAKLMIFAYQIWLAIAWAIGGGVGNGMTRFMARALRCPSRKTSISVNMCYPYYIRWTGKHGSYRHLLPFKPQCPMLFLYGRKKPFMFHSSQWQDWLNSQPLSRARPMNTAHWVMLDRPDEFNAELLDWLSYCKAMSSTPPYSR